MNKIGVVILNYGSPDDTIYLAKSLLGLRDVIEIVIVDNFSSIDNQLTIHSFLSNVNSENLHFIKSAINLGYGEGNNLGLAKLFDHLGCQFSLILNPDIILEHGFSLEALYDCSPNDINLFTGVIDQHDSKYSTFVFNEKNFRSKKNLGLKIDGRSPIYPSGCCWGMSEKIWNDMGGFSKYLFLYFEELDYIYRYKKSFGRFPEITVIPSIAVIHSEGGSTGSSPINSIISPLADYWSSASRIIFCRRHLVFCLPIAFLYNSLKIIRRVLILRITNAKSILYGTVRGFSSE